MGRYFVYAEKNHQMSEMLYLLSRKFDEIMGKTFFEKKIFPIPLSKNFKLGETKCINALCQYI